MCKTEETNAFTGGAPSKNTFLFIINLFKIP